MPIDADGKNQERELGAAMPPVGRRDTELKAGEQDQHRGGEMLKRVRAGPKPGQQGSHAISSTALGAAMARDDARRGRAIACV